MEVLTVCSSFCVMCLGLTVIVLYKFEFKTIGFKMKYIFCPALSQLYNYFKLNMKTKCHCQKPAASGIPRLLISCPKFVTLFSYGPSSINVIIIILMFFTGTNMIFNNVDNNRDNERNGIISR